MAHEEPPLMTYVVTLSTKHNMLVECDTNRSTMNQEMYQTNYPTIYFKL